MFQHHFDINFNIPSSSYLSYWSLVVMNKFHPVNILHFLLSPVHNISVKSMYNCFSVFPVFIVLILTHLPTTSSQKTHRLFWDDKNPVFNRGNNRMFVEDGDDIAVICPQNSAEYNNIYWSKKQYVFDNCDHNLDMNSVKLITCEPYSGKEFKFQVTKFSWVSLNPTFFPGKPIYLLSQLKFCKSDNMKIAVILKKEEVDNVDRIKEASLPERVVQQRNSTPSLYRWSHLNFIFMILFIACG